MTPKYRGDEEDYLDSEEERGSHSSGKITKKKKPKVGFLPETEANAEVVEVFPNQCKVLDQAGVERACTYRKAKLPSSEIRERAPVAVGDRVRIEPMGARDGVIDGVCERKNFLARPAPERAMRHTLVANVDKLVIVAAALEPSFSPGLVDRFLVAAQAAGITPVICVTKLDLWGEQTDKPWELYRSLGFPVYETCSKMGLGLSELKKEIEGYSTTFCGHSGVGKTSILNALLGYEVGRTGEISSATGKGQHTTTGAYRVPGSKWVDTPGIREFGLWGVRPEELRSYFPEMLNLTCGETDCWHRDEADCRARSLLRYGSYRRILESLMAGEN